jgi:guanylate kinase
MRSKKLIILCGPSGSGKTTVAHHLLEEMPQLAFSVSATTRERRMNEVDGHDYYFLSQDDFEKRLKNDEFVEYEEVYKGTYYGTLKSELERIWSSGKTPVLDIDVLGAQNIKKTFAPQALAIFVHPVSLENIKQRLSKRNTESAESFEKRIQRAEEELNMCGQFDKVVYNDDLAKALNKAEEYIKEYLVANEKQKV